MTKERVTETVDRNGNVTQRTIERGYDDGVTTDPAVTTARRDGGGGGLIAAILLIALLAVGAWLVFGGGLSENREDDAVAEAAKDVGRAAEKAGDSIEKAVDKAVK